MSDPIEDVLAELRSLNHTVEAAIQETRDARESVTQLKVDVAANAQRSDEIARKSDHRARIFRIMWGTLGILLVISIVGGSITGVLVEQRLSCFQTWANDTAQRSERLAKASNLRIRALNESLDVLADPTSTPSDRIEAIQTAAQAGDVYEQIAAANPPVPAEELDCAVFNPGQP